MGARLAVRTATSHPDVVAACGGFHCGGLATDDPDSPHLKLSSARARFVFGHADHDRSMAPDAAGRLGQALQDAGLEASNEICARALHGYTMADTSARDPEATERHSQELQATRRAAEKMNSPGHHPRPDCPFEATAGQATAQGSPAAQQPRTGTVDAGNKRINHASLSSPGRTLRAWMS